MKTTTIKNVFGLWLSAGLLLSMNSCSDFLKEESQDEVIPRTVVDYKELLMGSGYQGKEEPSTFVYFLDDDVEFNLLDENVVGSNDARRDRLQFTWQPSFVNYDGNGLEIASSPGSTPYARYYAWIMGCNAVLDNINAAIGTEPERNRVKAEALAVRAIYYFQLANLYGEPYTANPESLSIPLKLHSGIEETYSKRATVKEVYTQVVGDLEEALRLMEPLQIIRGDFHINQRAIHTFLSRVYLHMNNWEQTIKHADAVFESGGRVAMLLPFVGAATGGSNTYLNYDNPEVEWVFGGYTQPSQSTYMPSLDVVSSFETADVRLSYLGKASPATHYYLVSKLVSGTQLTQVIRSSEALLNRAEAYAELKNTAAATADLNLLRSNRITNYANQNFTSAEDALEAIRTERRKEFCYEGFRWFDLRRYGRPAIEHRYQEEVGGPILTFTLTKNDPMYTLPFPSSLFTNNPGFVQNPSALMGERVGK
ncbi:RagB/SusD family nutrient uptake outer membrane protein [Sphingobacterium sp. MYb382]|uniref:RagB/SusD family nutrient uptake outer membrane protein n=1 Tax=Sphingobacterium sp. MYb382 TaxID=2745278 RepID=UPI0030A25D31